MFTCAYVRTYFTGRACTPPIPPPCFSSLPCITSSLLSFTPLHSTPHNTRAYIHTCIHASSGSEDGSIKLWDLRAPGCQRSYDNTASPHPAASAAASTVNTTTTTRSVRPFLLCLPKLRRRHHPSSPTHPPPHRRQRGHGHARGHVLPPGAPAGAGRGGQLRGAAPQPGRAHHRGPGRPRAVRTWSYGYGKVGRGRAGPPLLLASRVGRSVGRSVASSLTHRPYIHHTTAGCGT